MEKLIHCTILSLYDISEVENLPDDIRAQAYELASKLHFELLSFIFGNKSSKSE
ncbi:hypothetical protein [Peromfec virus RodF8_10]|uniref:Uncharacterized protein n=1 Tax=Peromfec virus RodF8_10 TaxID=2929357 RepID=A0A976N292_9VIRU|nr:hypothetical protein [Peromfec virus RodF8_10]